MDQVNPLYQERKENVESFVADCKQHEHYQHLNPRPERFENWQDERGIMQEYGTWIMTESNCPSLKLDMDFPYKTVLEEVMPQYHQFVNP